MSKRGRIPKQNELKTGHRDNNLQVLKGGAEFPKPAVKHQWLASTKRNWKNYWNSELSSTAQPVDLPAFYRLFQFYDEVERANRMVLKMGNKGLLSVGSQGQPKVNPLIDLTIKLESSILKLEQELGLTPLARQRLGIAFGEAQIGFKQLQEFLKEDEIETVDPRLLLDQLEEE